MMKFKNSSRQGRWLLKLGPWKRRVKLRSRKPGKWFVKFRFRSGRPNRMRKMERLPRLKRMMRMEKMERMKPMLRLLSLPRMKMKHK